MRENRKRRLSLPVASYSPKEHLEISGEEERLGKSPPLTTILYLSIGPLASQTVQALYGVVNLFWVSKSIGDKGIEVFGAISVIDFIILAFSNYLMTSIDIRVSYIFGEKSRIDECSQIFVDFIRFSFVLSVLAPAIILPATRPLVEWFGSSKEISRMCYEYMIPCSFGSFFTFLYMSCCGLIQSEGRSFAFGVAQIVSLLLDMFVFAPLFLLYFKTGIWGATLSTVISQTIVTIVLLIQIFRGKYTITPTFSMLFKKFSSESWESLKIGLASLVGFLTVSIPEILLQKYLNMAATHQDQYDVCIKVWGVIEKLYQFVGGTNDAFAIGFVPAASFAFGSHQYKRLLKLFWHTNWITIVLSVIYSIFVIFFPSQIASIWSKDHEFLIKCKSMIPKVFYVTVLFPIEYTVPCFLQALQKVAQSTILGAMIYLVPIPLFSTILYFTDKNNPDRLMWTYVLSDSFGAILCTIFAIPSLKMLFKESNIELNNEQFDSVISIRSSKSENCCSTPLLEDKDYKE